MPVNYEAEFLKHSQVSTSVTNLNHDHHCKGKGNKSEIVINHAQYCRKS